MNSCQSQSKVTLFLLLPNFQIDAYSIPYSTATALLSASLFAFSLPLYPSFYSVRFEGDQCSQHPGFCRHFCVLITILYPTALLLFESTRESETISGRHKKAIQLMTTGFLCREDARLFEAIRIYFISNMSANISTDFFSLVNQIYTRSVACFFLKLTLINNR